MLVESFKIFLWSGLSEFSPLPRSERYTPKLSGSGISLIAAWFFLGLLYPCSNNFDEAFKGLVELMHSNSDYVKQHTQLLNSVLKWRKNNESQNCLLTGKDRVDALQWLKKEFTKNKHFLRSYKKIYILL